MLPFIYRPFWLSTVTTNKLLMLIWTFKDPNLNNKNFPNYSQIFLGFHKLLMPTLELPRDRT